jgi:hypothetical protein
MNIFLPKLLRKTLRQRSYSMFSGGESAGHNIPSDACCGSGKDQSALLPILERVLLERSDNLLGESEPGFDINLVDSLDILICNL